MESLSIEILLEGNMTFSVELAARGNVRIEWQKRRSWDYVD
jgi:hypothetical protein